jgi:outer membrane protein assembly factor BamB
MQSPLVRAVAFVALGGMALFALGWGGGALLSALLASRGTHTPPSATATATSAPSITIGVQDQQVYATRASDNTILWSFSTDGSVLPSPPMVNGVVYVATDEGHLYALQIVDGTEIWGARVAGNRPTSSPEVANDVVYVATQDGHVSALQAGDGSFIWQTRVRVDGPVTGPPTVAADMISIQTENGTTYTLRASDGMLLTPTPTSGGDNG